jgi:hypothetical protein
MNILSAIALILIGAALHCGAEHLLIRPWKRRKDKAKVAAEAVAASEKVPTKEDDSDKLHRGIAQAGAERELAPAHSLSVCRHLRGNRSYRYFPVCRQRQRTFLRRVYIMFKGLVKYWENRRKWHRTRSWMAERATCRALVGLVHSGVLTLPRPARRSRGLRLWWAR